MKSGQVGTRGEWKFTLAIARLVFYSDNLLCFLKTSTYITLQGDLCNEPTFLLSKFNEWISVTRARLKAGPSHPLDILITIATVAVGAFFCLVIASQLPVPWAKIFGRKEEEEEENEDDEEEEADNQDGESKEGEVSGHAKSE